MLRKFCLFAALSLASIAGCSSDDPSAPGDEQLPTVAISTFDRSGGSVEVADGAGFAFRLGLPSNAIFEPTDLTISAVEAPAEHFARFIISRTDLTVIRRFELTITLPDGVDGSGMVLAVGEGASRVLLETEFDATNGTLQAGTAALSFASGAPRTDSTESNVDVVEMDCAAELAALKAKVDASKTYFETGELGDLALSPVPALLNQYSALENQCVNFEHPELGDSFEIMSLFGDIACVKYGQAVNALLDLSTLPSGDDEAEALRKRTTAFLEAASVAELEDVFFDEAACDLPEYPTVVDSVMGAYVDRLATTSQIIPGLEGERHWGVLWVILKQYLVDLTADAAILGDDDVFPEGVKTRIVPRQFELLRNRAWEICRVDSEQLYLADLYQLGGIISGIAGIDVFDPDDGEYVWPDWVGMAADDLARDIQYCGTELQMSVIDGLGEELIVEFMGGLEPGDTVHQTMVTAPLDGLIELDGSIRGILCSNGIDAAHFAASERLVARVGDTVLHEFDLVDGFYLSVPALFAVTEMLEAADLEPVEGTTVTLEIWREGAECEGLYGANEFFLLKIDVELEEDEPELTLTGEWALTVDNICSGPITIVQSGTDLTVEGQIGGQPQCPFPILEGSGSGTLVGDDVSLGVAFSQLGDANFSGTVNASRTEMSGTYMTSTSSGAWTAIKSGS